MTSLVTIQNALNAGELTPSLFGRTDLDKYARGCSTARNFFASYKGGMSSRAGLAYIGMCKQQYPTPPRDIPFQFSIDQGYVLEFGELYMRIKSDGAYVIEASKAVTSVNTSGLFAVVGHGYTIGDWIYDTDNTGFSGLTWIVASTPTADTFTVTDLFGNAITSATASTGGIVARIYTVISPYHAIDLPYLKYTQSADVMTLCCVNQDTGTEYPPYDLSRVSNTSWTFTQQTFSSSISAPTNVICTAFASTTISTYYSYVVTAVDATTGEESVASSPATTQNVDISLNLGSNTIIWTAVANASSYNVYAATPSYGTQVPVSSLYGFIGTALGPSFVDTNITPDFTKVPPQHTDPFARGVVKGVNITVVGNGHYDQSTVGYNVTTGTGTGFAGSPVISAPYIYGTGQAGGTVLGFLTINHGKGYTNSDTISFTDSGGGHATGGLTFAANAADGDVLYFNSVKTIFKKLPLPSPTAGEIYTPVENTKELTVQSLSNTLNASNLLSISVASYSYSSNNLVIIYKLPGTVGNSYQYGATPTTSNLAGGGTAGSGATGSLVIGPTSGTYPSVAAYFQDRRVYANSTNQPDTYWMSQPGLFSNMDSSIPVTAGDSITGTPWAQQINGIQFLVPMPGGLVVLTGKGAWQVNGGQAAAITPSNQTATAQAYNGCNAIVPPQTINYDILYVQSKGSIWRDLSYNFYTNIYTGTDLTTLSSHLFTDFQSVQAAWAEEPFKLLWVVRNDGKMLSLTYLKEQEVYAWTRHDTNGLFVGVCSVTELPVDAVYVITQRYIQNQWRYYSERMDNRIWNTVEDAFCVDAGLSYPMNYPAGTLQVSAAELDASVTVVNTVSNFTSDNIGDVVRVGGGKVIITGYTSGTILAGTVTQDITQVITDNSNNMPLPAISGDWSISTPTTVVTNLNHLEGMEVAILADGSVVPNQTVTNNTITLPVAASQIVVGLPYTCQVQTMYLDVPPVNGQSVQNKRKNISAVGVRVEASRGLQVGADQIDASTQPDFREVEWVNMNEIKERNMFVNAGTAVPLYTGDYYKTITSGWSPEGQIAIQQVYPLPANILALIGYTSIGDDK